MTSRALFLAVALLWAAALGRDSVETWVAATVLPPLHPATSPEVRDRTGTLLRAYTVEDGLWRLGARPEEVDPRFLAMLKAWEDRRFDTHEGVDPLALLRAGWQSLWAGRVVSGGSTLTMQVARLLEDGSTGKWQGKLRQMRVALALEKRLSKSEILTLYLALAPYGGNIEGLRAASLVWFGKEPRRLTPAEAALLVALPQSPETRRPDRARHRAEAARDRVLERMVEAGLLSTSEAEAAMSEPLPALRADFPQLAPHLSDRARAAQPEALRLDLTLDATLQKALERLAEKALRGRNDALSIAVLVADHRSGEILASVGSSGFEAERAGYIDMTRALRSPGSTLKPLVYALAFDQGLAHPDTILPDRPVAFGKYAPQNFDRQFRGDIRASEALRLSLNVPVVLLAESLGPSKVLAALERAGTHPVIPGGKAGLALTLGGVGLTLEDLVQLYAGLANGGQARPLAWLRTDVGSVPTRLTSRAAAWQVSHILAGMPPPANAPNARLAYKTGTSYGHRDAWAIGFDGQHVAGVWMGRPDGSPVPGAFGGDLAAPVLFEVFQRLKPALSPLPPPPPETLLEGSALPQNLQRFRSRLAPFDVEGAPELAFPPDGARIALEAGGLSVKLREGQPPFAVLADGHPLRLGERRREFELTGLSKGFLRLSVIDSEGRAVRASVELE